MEWNSWVEPEVHGPSGAPAFAVSCRLSRSCIDVLARAASHVYSVVGCVEVLLGPVLHMIW